jgi:hypothetical protein
MKNFTLIISCIFILFAIACRKDQILPPPPGIPVPCASKLELIPITDTCFELLPNDPWGFSPVYPGQTLFHRFPAFDPATYEQFLFFSGQENNPNHPIHTPLKGANLCTGEVWTIHDSIQFNTSFTRLPKWSEKGWIIAARLLDGSLPGERGLYKIKANGDSLAFLLNQNLVFPAWVDSGNSIILHISGHSQMVYVLNENGDFTDTIHHALTYPAYFKAKIAARRVAPPDFIDIVVFQNGEIIWSHPYTENFSNFTGLDWLNEEEIIWTNYNGIYRANITTGQISPIKEPCPNIKYTSVSAARDGSNRLLLTRVDYLFENGITDSMSLRYNISLYEIDTGKEYYVKVGEM